MALLVISTSLKPVSRSRILAREGHRIAGELGSSSFIDLRDHPLPLADGATFGLPTAERLSAAIRGATGILIAAPVYNYDLSAAAKNLIEHTGKAWEDQVVGFLLAAGGQRSYMAAQGFAGSLALDFRSVVVPRFVYVTREAFAGDAVGDPEVRERIAGLVQATLRIARALAPVELPAAPSTVGAAPAATPI